MHALLWEDGELMGHACVTLRRLIYDGGALRTGYVEGLAIRADRRRQGHGKTLMGAIDRIVRGGYELGALSATDDGVAFYSASVFVLPVSAELDITRELTCDWREGDVW